MNYFTPQGSLISQIAYPNWSKVTRSYDYLARLTGTFLKNSGNTTLNKHEYDYDVAHRITRQTRNSGDFVEYTYDVASQLKTAYGQEVGGSPARVHERFGYTYDAAGNLNFRTNNALVLSFSMNDVNQPTGAGRSGNLTVAGVTAADATSVTVADNGNSPVNAARYADRTFARTNVTVVNGDNTFTATAQDSLGRTDTVTETPYLPASVSYSYDSNGNLLSDGRRHFTYDDENQLTQVVVTNRTKSEFAYDGKMRRRVRKESVWTGLWQQVLEVHYLYDGNLVVQERQYDGATPTAFPQRAITYTRGLDLSGSRQSAGGIGGLLARSKLSTLDARLSTSFYHSDIVGNITALVDTNQQVVARYLYEPFGALIAMSGPLAEANTYRFSSKEAHEQSGLVYYLYRSYDPGLQRWLNRDPIGERGGINLYGYVGNNPISRIDPLGLTFLVSPTPFPGQEGTYGPYVLNIPDGSSLVKTPHTLDPKDLFKKEWERCKRLQEKSPWAALNPYDEAGFDTPYFKFFNPDNREYYWYNGKIYADNEINYFGIGMYEKWAGDPMSVAVALTFWWKVKQYGETPSANTYYWLEKGYNDYSGFTDPSKPLPKTK